MIKADASKVRNINQPSASHAKLRAFQKIFRVIDGTLPADMLINFQSSITYSTPRNTNTFTHCLQRYSWKDKLKSIELLPVTLILILKYS